MFNTSGIEFCVNIYNYNSNVIINLDQINIMQYDLKVQKQEKQICNIGGIKYWGMQGVRLSRSPSLLPPMSVNILESANGIGASQLFTGAKIYFAVANLR